MDEALLEQLGFDPEDDALADDPLVTYQLDVLQATKEAREAGVPLLALEYRLMDVLYGLYGSGINTGDVTDEELSAEEADEAALHLVDAVASARRARESGVDDETIRENLEAAAEAFDDEERFEAFY